MGLDGQCVTKIHGVGWWMGLDDLCTYYKDTWCWVMDGWCTTKIHGVGWWMGLGAGVLTTKIHGVGWWMAGVLQRYMVLDDGWDWGLVYLLQRYMVLGDGWLVYLLQRHMLLDDGWDWMAGVLTTKTNGVGWWMGLGAGVLTTKIHGVGWWMGLDDQCPTKIHGVGWWMGLDGWCTYYKDTWCWMMDGTGWLVYLLQRYMVLDDGWDWMAGVLTTKIHGVGWWMGLDDQCTYYNGTCCWMVSAVKWCVRWLCRRSRWTGCWRCCVTIPSTCPVWPSGGTPREYFIQGLTLFIPVAVVNSWNTKTHSSKKMTGFCFENADVRSICYCKQRVKSTPSFSSECVETKLYKLCTSFTSHPCSLCGMVWYRTFRVKATTVYLNSLQSTFETTCNRELIL